MDEYDVINDSDSSEEYHRREREARNILKYKRSSLDDFTNCVATAIVIAHEFGTEAIRRAQGMRKLVNKGSRAGVGSEGGRSHSRYQVE